MVAVKWDGVLTKGTLKLDEPGKGGTHAEVWLEGRM